MSGFGKVVFRIAVAAVAASAFGASSYAADMITKPSCACSEPISSSAKAIGQFTAVTGSVVAVGSNGAVPGAVGGPIVSGMRVSTGPASSAAIRVGRSCNLNLAENTDAEVLVNRGNLCVRVASVAPAIVPATGPSLSGLALPAATAAFGLGAAAVIISTKDKRVSD